MAKKNIPVEDKVQIITEAVEDRLALDPVTLDLSDKALLFDYVIVCGGNSDTHIRAITNAVLEKIDDENITPPKVSGQAIAEWVLMDFGDVVLHVLTEEARAKYKLETFWSTAQPKGALPPSPEGTDGIYAGAAPITDEGFDDSDGDDFDEDEDLDEMTDEEIDALDLEGEDEDDALFFDAADAEVEPVDEPDDLESSEDTEEKSTKEA